MGEALCLFVVARLFHAAAGSGELLCQLGILRRGARLLLQRVKAGGGRLGVADACTAEDHHRRMDALFVQDALGLEQLKLQAQWPKLFLAKQIDVFIRKAVCG